MDIQEYRYIQAERTALEKLLAQLPSSRLLERMSLKARKNIRSK